MTSKDSGQNEREAMPSAEATDTVRVARMGYGAVAVGDCFSDETGEPGIIYMALDHTGEIGESTTHIYPEGSRPPSGQVLACVSFKTPESVDQTISILERVKSKYWAAEQSPAPASPSGEDAAASTQDSGEADVWPVPVSIETNYDVGQTVELIFEDDEDAERFTRLYSKHMAQSAAPMAIANELEQLRKAYEMAVQGRADMRNALREARAAAPQGLTDEQRNAIAWAAAEAGLQGVADYAATLHALFRASVAEQSAAPMAVRTHTTQPGESVMGIALRECGNEKEWRHILACNPQFADMLPHEYFPVGTVLTLPPLPRASEQADEAVTLINRASAASSDQ